MWDCWNEWKSFGWVKMKCFTTRELAETFSESHKNHYNDQYYFTIEELIPHNVRIVYAEDE